MIPEALYLGLDFGTSGARAILIDGDGKIAQQAQCQYDIQDCMSWLRALQALCHALDPKLRPRIQALAIDGTSSTVVLSDGQNIPLAPPMLYHDAGAASQTARIAQVAPPGHTATSATSSLAKLLHLLQQHPQVSHGYFSDQASWLGAMLTGKPGISDYHNALKLGYDVEALAWPQWLAGLGIAQWLPQVVAPGSDLGPIAKDVAAKLGLPQICHVRAGTTDSIAAFLASGADTPGTAVTSLGSTLVLKLLSTTRVEDAAHGIYSHRLGNLWLAGGASNSGGAVLRRYFDDDALAQLSQQIDPMQDSPLDYYPLLKPGERFPFNDAQRAPCLEPRPLNNAEFLQGMLQGIANIEARGYALLMKLGATPLKQVLSAGGGARNMNWIKMRQRLLGVPVSKAPQDAAAYGAALLART